MTVRHAHPRLRIVQIIPSLVVGGAERMATWLAQAQLDAGHDVHLVVLKRGGELGTTLSPELRRRTWCTAKASRWDARVLPRLVTTLAHLSPDVVHTHLFTSLSWGAVAARAAQVPVVVHTQHAVHDDDHRYLPTIRRGLAPLLDAIVGCNAATVRDLRARGYAPGVPAVAIDNGIPLAGRPQASLTRAPFTIGAVGRLVPIKGHDHLLEALALLRREGADARLVLLGEGPERGALEARVRQLGLGDVVSMPGSVHDVSDRLASVDLFCQPSLSEAMPMALLEAAAAGLPLLVTDVGGAPTLLQHGAGGWIVPPGDPAALANAVRDALVLTDAAFADLGRRAREVVVGRYDVHHMARRYEALYREHLAT